MPMSRVTLGDVRDRWATGSRLTETRPSASVEVEDGMAVRAEEWLRSADATGLFRPRGPATASAAGEHRAAPHGWASIGPRARRIHLVAHGAPEDRGLRLVVGRHERQREPDADDRGDAFESRNTWSPAWPATAAVGSPDARSARAFVVTVHARICYRARQSHQPHRAGRDQGHERGRSIVVVRAIRRPSAAESRSAVITSSTCRARSPLARPSEVTRSTRPMPRPAPT